MVNQQLVDYIKNVQAQGFTEPTVREVLFKNGWQIKDVEEAFSYLKMSMQAPVPAGSAPMPATATNPSAQVNQTVVGSVSKQEKSPYAVVMAIVLFVSLLVFLNSVIDDTAEIFGSSVNSKFIFDIVLIIPFLAVSFLLQSFFPLERRSQFATVFEPYFIVSGFLLVRLLWNVSSYLLSANTTYGIYLVLLLIILVLTGIILFVQNYIKK